MASEALPLAGDNFTTRAPQGREERVLPCPRRTVVFTITQRSALKIENRSCNGGGETTRPAYVANDRLTWVRGKHTFGFGGEYRALQDKERSEFNESGTFNFSALNTGLRDVNSGSSNWVHATVGKLNFNWQPGYFGVTVSPSHVEKVKRYILNQEEHHRHKSFEEEYIEMLKLAGIDYDECYVW